MPLTRAAFTASLAWSALAACQGLEDYFFPPEPGDRDYPEGVDIDTPNGLRLVAGVTLKRYKKAKRICGGCPVRAECLEYSYSASEGYGIWGGLAPEERNTAKRKAA